MNNDSTISDGFGNIWTNECPRCGQYEMSVVRPGKIQCDSKTCFLYGSIEDAINALRGHYVVEKTPEQIAEDLEKTLSIFNDHE